MNVNALAIDLGTTACKASVVSIDGAVLGSGLTRIPVAFGEGGAAEQDAELVWTLTLDACRAAVAEAGATAAESIVAVCVASQWSSSRTAIASTPAMSMVAERSARDQVVPPLSLWKTVSGIGPCAVVSPTEARSRIVPSRSMIPCASMPTCPVGRDPAVHVTPPSIVVQAVSSFTIAAVTPGSHVVLVGAGFISFTILNAILSRGATLTVVEVAPRILPRMVDAPCAEIVAAFDIAEPHSCFARQRIEVVEVGDVRERDHCDIQVEGGLIFHGTARLERERIFLGDMDIVKVRNHTRHGHSGALLQPLESGRQQGNIAAKFVHDKCFD